MHNNALLLARYANHLQGGCLNATIKACVSTSPNDFHLLFDNGLFLSIRFYKERTFFLTPDEQNFPKKNVLNPFKLLVGLKVKSITPYPCDRGFVISLGVHQLHVQCFGRRSGILLTVRDKVIGYFKTAHAPEEFTIQNKTVQLEQTPELFKESNPFITGEMIEDLTRCGMFSGSDQNKVWDNFLKTLSTCPLHIYKSEDTRFGLSIFKKEFEVESYSDIGEAFNDFGKLYMAQDRFATLHQSLLSSNRKDSKKLNARLKKVTNHLDKIKNGENIKELADVIMANLQVIPSQATSTTLFNFYSNSEVTIPLKKQLSAQKNAERLYQKSKNVHLEIRHAEKLLKEANEALAKLSKEQNYIEESTDYRSLQSLNKTKEKKTQSDQIHHQLPYRVYHHKGFYIWVGKSAKHNDDMLKRVHKHDLWLHARGVAGSHVLLKN
ncbi:MAG: putative ribosome quality control (RQC) complex YloA/Tae2 family protein, partial [Bacteroidia bacterium]